LEITFETMDFSIEVRLECVNVDVNDIVEISQLEIFTVALIGFGNHQTFDSLYDWLHVNIQFAYVHVAACVGVAKDILSL
jgi:hypothetical protein